MTPTEEFETILKQVVQAKRLSASKMSNLTDLAMKNMASDTQLVSILYRTHKSLPATSKVSSLYVFDALARAAKHQVTKHNIVGDVYTQPGNCATFLLKLGGVVEGLFQDMIASKIPESKEKTKKILDIWAKGNTFPPSTLSQLTDVLKEVDKVAEVKSSQTTDPRVSTASPVSTTTPPIPAITDQIMPQLPSNSLIPTLDPQSALLALLTQAASVATPAIPSITGFSNPSLDAAQLAVLQQLANTAASVPSVTQSLPSATAVNAQNYLRSSSGVSGSSRSPPSNREERNNTEKLKNRYHSPENEPGYGSSYEQRDSIRGSFRGGFRARGRGDRFGRRWDDRDRFGDTERDRSPQWRNRKGRSRSRSPPSTHGGDRRQPPRDRSLPRRHPIDSSSVPHQETNNTAGKDEFGRDIRPESPSPSHKSPLHPPLNSPVLSNNLDSISPPSPKSHHNHDSVTPLLNANTSKEPSTQVPSTSNAVSVQPGMDSFDPTTFDYTSPQSWEALGKMWQVTNGYLPSTEQLMQFVITYTANQVNSQNQEPNPFSSQQPQQNQWSGGFRGRGRGRGTFSRGRGGLNYGNSRTAFEDQNQNSLGLQGTDAVVLGEKNGGSETGDAPTFHMQDVISEQKSPSGGRMQKVGDKWVFVRGSMDVS